MEDAAALQVADAAAKIKSGPHWRVAIRPSRMTPGLVAFAAMEKAIAASQVRLRRWPYPSADAARRGTNWIEAEQGRQGSAEYWRLFRSGQFVHLIAVDEDAWVDPDSDSWFHVPRPSVCAGNGTFLDITSTVFRLTEVHLFASRLADAVGFGEACQIAIDLHGMRERELANVAPNYLYPTRFVSHIDAIHYEPAAVSLLELRGRAEELAREAAAYVFERFGWDAPPARLAGIQSELQSLR